MPDRPKRQYGYVERPEVPQQPHHRQQDMGRPKRPNSAKTSGHPSVAGILLRSLWVIITFIVLLPFKLLSKIPFFRRKEGSSMVATLFKGIILLGALGVVFVLIIFVSVSRDLPDPDKLTDRTVAQSTKIYDRTGEHVLFEIFADQKRTIVELEDIPKDVVNGVIATEDTAFYEHKGVRPLSILRSFVYGLIGRGRVGGGASTLTQQLVKNAILSPEQTVTRKVKEIILSIRLEQKYTKDQILKIYFNEIPYGSTNYGIQSAAQSYFGKDVKDLTLAESAVLAGLPKAPTKYLNDSQALFERRNFVLGRMYAEGFITEQQKNDAQAEPLEIKQNFDNITAPHFVLYVKEKLVEEYGEQTVETGGLKVITSLDWNMQQAAERAVTEESEKLFNDAGANNTALVALDPKTGQILAMVGSRDFFDNDIDGQFNVATLGKRQPGSSFKPIIYTAAFEKGYTPDTVLFDVKTNFSASGKPYEPLNYDLQERGPVTMRQAIQGSLNIPAVKTLYLVGEKKGVEFAERLGYSTLQANNFGLSLVLGGGEVKLIEHVAAYATFANGGAYFQPVPVLKVEKPNGDVLSQWKQEKGEPVLKKEIAATISSVLSDDAARAYAFGGGGVLTLPSRPVAAKTGTTNNYVDAWTVGYTPSLVAGVWVGNTNNSPMTRGYGGSRVAAPIWNSFMREALKDTPVESFPGAPANDAEKPVLRGSDGGSVTLLIDKITGKRATSSTPENLIVERTYTQPHSILHYVLKDDPRGAVPEDPGADPQYTIWENAIQDWIRRKKEENPDWEIVFEDPPTDFDDEHSLELIPTLDVVYPSPSTTLYSRQINTDIRVSSPRGVAQVTYKIDERYVGVVREHPFNLNYNAQDFEDGSHVLTIIVEDDIGNRLEQMIPFVIDAGVVSPRVSWVGTNRSVDSNSIPAVFFLEPFKQEQIKEVRVYEQFEGEGRNQIATIKSFDDLFNGQITFRWAPQPRVGRWELLAETVLTSGQTAAQDVIWVDMR